MEESPEAQMQTDVTSSAEDVAEAQEVTTSNGNVETVVIVENVTEDDSTTIESVDKQATADSEVPNTMSKSPQTSPQKLASQILQTSPQKPVPETKSTESPNKLSDTPKSILIEEHSYNKTSQEDESDTPSPITTLSAESVDSSKLDGKSPQKNISTPKKLSPIKVIDIHKSPKVSLVTKTSPSKEAMQGGKHLGPKNDVSVTPAVNGKITNTDINEEHEPKNTSPVEIVIDKGACNDSQMELTSDVSEKEHNKSISRELKSLIKSAKESKIISECTQLTTKTRKSRATLDVSNSSLNVSSEAEKIKDVRRYSSNSQKSNCSEKSEKVPPKRSMRSQNPEFVNKVKQFLNSVTSKVQKESDEGTDEELEKACKESNINKELKEIKHENSPSLPKKKKSESNQEVSSKLRSDPYCWRCHWEVEQPTNEKSHSPMMCTVCPRSFHYKCLSGAERSKINTEKSWVCPECMAVLHAESSETRSPAMKKISLGMLCELLKHAVERMMDLNGVEPFMHPVDCEQFPEYEEYVVHPMDLSQMRENINTGLYGSTEAFVADIQWILHNSIIFNTFQSKLTASARTLVRSCRAEMGEIEACPECYAAAHARKPTWFTDVCSTPHMLLWAKLKGFPYWPAKGMSVNNAGLVDVRFFGAHDRAWVPAKDCFLYSEKDPNNFRTKRQDIIDSMHEAEEHIRNISRKYGKFVYPPFKTQFDPSKLYDQLKMMIPSFEGEVRAPVKDKPSPSMVKDTRRSNSKGSKGSFQDGELSEGEEAPAIAPRKMADGADIAQLEDEEKDKSMEVDVKEENNEKSARKRRRSEMEEAATFTIISGGSKEKKKRKETEKEPDNRIENNNVENIKAETESLVSTVSSKEDLEKAPEIPVSKVSPASEEAAPTPTNEPEIAKESPKLTPIKLVISTKSNKIIGKSTACKNNTSTPRVLPIKIRQAKIEKSFNFTAKDKANKEEKPKSQKRRNSKNKSFNNSVSDKTDNITDRKIERILNTYLGKERKDSDAGKGKEDTNKQTEKPATSKPVTPKPATPKPSTPKTAAAKPITPKPNAESPKAAKDRKQFDEDNASLAMLARRDVKGTAASNNISGMPTISSVRSLSASAQNTSSVTEKTNSIEVTVEPSLENLLIPTSTVTIRKETPKGKEAETSMVGRVGVRAFARMASPEPQKSKEVEVEIKAEPMDLDDHDRQLEKLDMMKAFRLRPVNPPVSNLREVRINKVVMTPLNARKTAAAKPPEVKPRARKTFPQPRKSDDGRSELNSKNSMVYIPIQPPITPGPRPPGKPSAPPTPMQAGQRPQAPIITTAGNSIVNTVTAPLVPSSMSQLTGPPTSTLPLVPTIGQVPTTVHTVPLITSVNGQWTFSLQPIMSVGGVDDTPSPVLNGLPERTNAPPTLLPNPATAATAASNNVTTTTMTAPGVMSVVPSVLPLSPVVVPTSQQANTQTTPPISTLSAAPTIAPNRTTVDCNANPGEPPRLQQRPVLMNPLDSHTPIGNVPPPSTAGPVTAKLNQNAVKLTDFFRTLLEDSLEKLDEPSCQVTTLRLQLEQCKWRNQQELEELKHNHDLVLAEMRSSFEKDKVRLTSELRRVAQVELEGAVKAAKSKQWCANCSQEAQFYCCWNTSYCDYPCQRAHWNTHFAVCTQQRAGDASDARLPPPPDALTKNTTVPTTTPTLTVGGKLAQARTAQESGQKQSSIIMSMIEDKSGNQTLRCLGTYKPPVTAPTNQISPIMINKQIMNNEDSSSKKVVTSGGYLIVGANAASSAAAAPARRPHSVHYCS